VTAAPLLSPPRPRWRRALAATGRAAVPGPLVSALLLAAAFPPLDLAALAWIGLVPLLVSRPADTARAALARGWWLGFWFFLVSLVWLVRVTAGGWIVLSAVCALYWAPFALLVRRWILRVGVDRPAANLGQILALGLAWCGLETLRAHLFTGFGWNALGVSQHANLALIQVADLGGVAAVSFPVILFNLGVAGFWLRRRAVGPRARPVELAPALLTLAAVLGYGVTRPVDPPPGATPFRAVLIQPNIPQYEKWTAAFVQQTYGVLDRQTRLAAAAHPAADLLVWPETTIPDDGSLGPAVRAWLAQLTAPGIPLLAGALVFEARGADVSWTNSALLVQPGGAFAARYDKRHRVMFGEYVPPLFKWLLPFLEKMTAIGEDVTPGHDAVVFPHPAGAFGVNICFEDIPPWLSRDLVRAGARLLVNQTNDAWFDPLWGSRQHLAHGVFRAVENRVPVLRCANTGPSAAIDARGRVGPWLRDPADDTFRVEGFLPTEVWLPPAGPPRSVYSRHGEVLGFSAAALALLLLGRAAWESRRAA
jgi:apolipoprotein N-acyltransferase